MIEALFLIAVRHVPMHVAGTIMLILLLASCAANTKRKGALQIVQCQITHGNGLSCNGRQAIKHKMFRATWQMNTTCRASAYESTAARWVLGSKVRMICVSRL